MVDNPKKLILILSLWAILIVWWRFLVVQLVLSDASSELTADVRQQEISKEEKEKIQDETEVFEEEHIQEKKAIIQPALPDKKYEPITLLVPPHVNAWALQQLRKHLFTKFGVLAYIQLPKTRYTYEELVREEIENPSVDIILAPSNRIYSFDDWWLTIDFKKPITPLFHDAFVEVIERHESTFIPFSLDPYVMLFDKQTISSDTMNIAHIQKILREQKQPLTFPFAISLENIQQVIYPWYNDLVLRFIQDALKQKNTYTLEYLIYEHTLNHMDIQAHVDAHSETYTRCKAFPHICMIATKQTNILPAQISHIAQLKESFGYDLREHGYNMSHLPLARTQYPFIGWWWIINKQSEHLWSVWAWITWYLQQSQNNTLALWPYTFPAFQWMYQQQRLQTRYSALMKHIQSIQVVTWWMNDIDKLLEDTPFKEVMNNEYDATIYIKELQNQQ